MLNTNKFYLYDRIDKTKIDYSNIEKYKQTELEIFILSYNTEYYICSDIIYMLNDPISNSGLDTIEFRNELENRFLKSFKELKELLCIIHKKILLLY